jgi:hypothetical protein
VGKPLESDSIPGESNRVIFGLDGLGPYSKDGEKVYNLFGWALLTPQEGESTEPLVREVVLTSGEDKYFFPVIPVYRSRPSVDKLAGMKLDLDHLGFYALIDHNRIKPGRYRVGLIIRDPSSGAAYYRDKPLYYLIKTPNSLDLESK